MFRLFSLLLILLGAAALAFGGFQFISGGAQPPTVSAPPPTGSSGFDAPDAATQPSASASRSMSGKSMGDQDMFGPAMATDEFLGSLRTVPIAHETPRGATFGRPFTVTVALDATGDDSATDSLPGTGNIGEGEAQVSDTVQAVVSGEAFRVEAITPDVQRISPLTENVWRWRVTPTAVGNQDLVIELFALMGDEALPLRTFRDSVEVKVSRIGQAVAFAQSISPITVVAGGIGSMLAGMFGFIGFFRRR